MLCELELELIQSHMAQKPVLRGEVGCACVGKGLISACSVARVAGWGACARGGVREREYRVVRGGGKSTRHGRKAGRDSAAVVILPGLNILCTGAGGTHQRSGAGVEVAENGR